GAPAVHGAQRGVLEPEPPGAFSREAAVARRERSRRGDARRTGRLVERDRCRFPVPSRGAAVLAWVVAGLTLRWTMPWATHWFSCVLQTMCGGSRRPIGRGPWWARGLGPHAWRRG